MEPDGVASCARFALPPTDRRFCGPDRGPEALRVYLRTGRGREAAKAALRRFEALFPYLAFLGEERGRDPFDPGIVEAYWVGHPLLAGKWTEPYPRLLRTLVNRGLPHSFVDRLLAHLPSDPVPTHSFHVLFVGVGSVTGAVPTTLPNMDRCRIAEGRVQEVGEGRVVVRVQPLLWEEGCFRLGPEAERQAIWDRDLVPELVPGDVVALHWETVADLLTGDRIQELRQTTDRALRAANEAAIHGQEVIGKTVGRPR